MISPGDLCTLQDALEYLSPQSGNTADEALIQKLIGRASGWIAHTALSRELSLGAFSECRNGTGTPQIALRRYPILSVQALYLRTQQENLAPATQNGFSLWGCGYVFDERTLYLRGAIFPPGAQNVLIEYQAGYLTPGIIALSQLTPWQADTNYGVGMQVVGGNFVFSALRPGQSGFAAPAWPSQQSATVMDGGVVWIATAPFPGIVAGVPWLPEAISVAALELVALQYRQRDRVGDTGEGLGPERVNYFMGAMSKTTQEALRGYRDVVPLWDAPP